MELSHLQTWKHPIRLPLMSDIKRDPEELLDEIEAFLIRWEMNPTDFGLQAKNDGALVFRLRQGKDVYSKTATELRRFMEAYRPLAAGKGRYASDAHA